MEIKDLAKQFVQHYYTTLQTNKAALIHLYSQNSEMTYGGDYFKGLNEIQEKIESFGFQKIVFQIDDLDAQGGPLQGSFICFVTGTLQMDDQETYKFSQVFNILPNGQGGMSQ